MAIRITSDNPSELSAMQYVIDTGILNSDRFFFEKYNLPTKLQVTYELRPKYQLVRDIVDKSNDKRIRSIEDIKYIVIHAAYCPDPIRSFRSELPIVVSYVVDSSKVTMTSEDDRYPWSLGNGSADIVNKNSISVMLVSDLAGQIAKEAIELSANLVKDLMNKYHIPISNVIRYSDISGRHSTGDFNKPEVWQDFLAMIENL